MSLRSHEESVAHAHAALVELHRLSANWGPFTSVGKSIAAAIAATKVSVSMIEKNRAEVIDYIRENNLAGFEQFGDPDTEMDGAK